MNKNREIRRGDIFIADLGNDGIGSEQHGKRPVLILQNDFGNFFSSTVTVVPITSSIKKTGLPTHYILKNTDFLRKTSMILAESIKTIDKCRLIRVIGRLDDVDMAGVEQAIENQLGFSIPEAVEAP